MRLLDFLFRPPTIDQFAQIFMREMRRAGIEEELKYDKENGRILRGSGDKASSAYLGNFYREHLSLPRRKRRRHIAQAVLSMKLPDELPDDFETARVNLRPKIWSRAGLEAMRLQTRIDGGDPDKFDMPEYEIGSHLVASLVYDLPTAMRSIGKDDLSNWGTTYYEALEFARENLDSTGMIFAKIGDGCYASATGDSYDASRLLVPSLIDRFEVQGDLVAMVPNRDTLVACGTDDDASLKIMLDLAKTADAPSRPLVPIPLRLDGDEWVDWFPDRTHPLFHGFRELALQYFVQVYDDQKSLLEQIHENAGADIFVASYTAIRKDDGTNLSYAVWTKGVPTLLPKVDWIIFGSVAEEDKGTAAIASWEKAQQVVGRLMQPTDYYPVRVHITEYPTAAELEELGMAEL
jgi:hypothetical protein